MLILRSFSFPASFVVAPVRQDGFDGHDADDVRYQRDQTVFPTSDIEYGLSANE
jgi:hypothetical protein